MVIFFVKEKTQKIYLSPYQSIVEGLWMSTGRFVEVFGGLTDG
jgi:hypothetical protein